MNRLCVRRGAPPVGPHPKWNGQGHAFYNDPYFLKRQLWYRAHDTWFTIANQMIPPFGRFCEFGCGIAPVAAWVVRYRPDWEYTLVDVPSPQYTFACHRMRIYDIARDISGGYDVIVALEVLEHLEHPLETLKELVAHLLPGGSLFVNYIDTTQHEADLMREREACVIFLHQTLSLVSDGDYWHYKKPL